MTLNNFDGESLVSVIMLNWNTPDMTYECVKSVSVSNYRNFTINVIDNGSSLENFGKLLSLIGDLAAVHRIEKNVGYVGGMNYALEIASQQNPGYFLIMNNDTVLDTDSIYQLVKTAEKNDDCCVVTGKVYHYDNPTCLQTVGHAFNRKSLMSSRIGYDELDIGQYNQECQREMIDDIFMLLPKAIYEKVGGYNTYFYLNYEQTDLILRIHDAGYQSVYTPLAKLYHKGSFSSGGLGNPYMMYWDGKSQMVLRFLHMDKKMFYKASFTSVLQSAFLLFKGLVGFLLLISSKKNLVSRYARFRGVCSGIMWALDPKPETGYNPFISK